MTALAHPTASSGPPRPAVTWGAGSTTGWVAAGFTAIGAGILAARAAGFHAPACALRSATGVACPVCGITRLSALLAHGHVATAIGLDLPGVAFLTVLAVTAGAQVVAARRRPVGWLSSPVLPTFLAALLSAHWAVTVVTGGVT